MPSHTVFFFLIHIIPDIRNYGHILSIVFFPFPLDTLSHAHAHTHSTRAAAEVSAPESRAAPPRPPAPPPHAYAAPAQQPGPQTAICSGAGGWLGRRCGDVWTRAPHRSLLPPASAVTPLLRASGGTRPAGAPRCRPHRPSQQLRAPGTPARPPARPQPAGRTRPRSRA